MLTRRGIQALSGADTLSPLVLMPLAYVAYFLSGSINFFPYRGTVGLNVYALWVAGGVAYLTGAILAGRIFLPGELLASSHARNWSRPQHWGAITTALCLAGMIGIAAVLLTRGIPILQGENRLGANGYAQGLSQFLVVGLGVFLFGLDRPNKAQVLAILVGGMAMLLLGFRSPVLVLLGLVAYWLVARQRIPRPRSRISAVMIVVGVLIGLVGVSWIAVFRFGAGPGAYLATLTKDGMPSWFTPLAPLWVTTREGVGVLSQLMSTVPSSRPYAGGRLEWSAVVTLLPGHQEGPREMIGALVGGRPGITITPSVLGGPYVDFGPFGVLAFMAAMGAGLVVIRAIAQRTGAAGELAYAYALVSCVLAIHSGLLDPIVLASIGLLLLIALITSSERVVQFRPGRGPHRA